MLGFSRKPRTAASRKPYTRHQLGINNRLESRCVLTTATLVAGVVTVEGTKAAESIELESQTAGSDQVLVVRNNGELMAKYRMSDVKQIEVRALGGDDKIAVSGKFAVPIILDGGEGNDVIKAGSTGAVILGGAGNDTLIGGEGRDILIGGMGADSAVGNGGDDILIGDSTQADDNTQALVGIWQQWNSNRSYQERVDALRPSTERPNRVPDLTLIDDGAGDTLQGGSGQDWFLTNNDKITDREKGEDVN